MKKSSRPIALLNNDGELLQWLSLSEARAACERHKAFVTTYRRRPAVRMRTGLTPKPSACALTSQDTAALIRHADGLKVRETALERLIGYGVIATPDRPASSID